MPRYQTKQRNVLLEHLNSHADEMLTASQIADALEKEGISRSAVYRNIQSLEQEGLLRKQAKSGTRESYYQFLGSESCKGCLHMHCVKCGKTVHMKHSEAELLAKKLNADDDFDLSLSKTVLYGVCKKCK